MNERPYRVGKGKPPVEHQFKKGERRNPKGRGKIGPVDVTGFFDELLNVAVGGRMKKVHPFEVALTNLAERAVKKRDMRAAARFVELCTSAGLLIDPPKGDDTVVYLISSAWTAEDWMEHYERLGPPPWPGPRDGLNNDHWRDEVLATYG